MILNGPGAPYNIWIKKRIPVPYVVVNHWILVTGYSMLDARYSMICIYGPVRMSSSIEDPVSSIADRSAGNRRIGIKIGLIFIAMLLEANSERNPQFGT